MKSTTHANAAYAKAYLNVFGSDISDAGIDAIEKAAHFLKEHRRALFLLKVPIIPPAVKRRGIKELSARFDLPPSIEKLFDMLLKRGCACFLADVFLAIVHEYNKRMHRETVVISSSHELSEAQKKKIMAFADRKFLGNKTYAFRLDARLIAGIKIMSDTMMWESSIDNYLRECTQAQIW